MAYSPGGGGGGGSEKEPLGLGVGFLVSNLLPMHVTALHVVPSLTLSPSGTVLHHTVKNAV